jgi:hypothetical protein
VLPAVRHGDILHVTLMFIWGCETVVVVIVVFKPLIERHRRDEPKSEWRVLRYLVECQVDNLLNIFVESFWRTVYLFERQMVVALHANS